MYIMQLTFLIFCSILFSRKYLQIVNIVVCFIIVYVINLLIFS